MKSLKSKTSVSYHSQPVWCHHCCIRIAPYDSRTVHHGKNYHRDCYSKVLQANGKTPKN
jgi:hypothetical protein